MIFIKEAKPQKIPGVTSLFVTFPYNSATVDAIKQCTPCNYVKKTQTWEIPTTRLAKFVHLVNKFEDIDLRLLKDKPVKEDIEYQLDEYKTTPYPYQHEGIEYGLNHDNFLLLDAPGLGKTLQIIYLAQELKKREQLQHCLIICGLNTLKTNWEKEIQKHSDLDCHILGKRITSRGKVVYGGISERLAELQNDIKEFFVITNIETLRDKRVFKQLNSGVNKFDMIVLDECHVCKNPTSAQGSNLLKLTNAKHKIGLTGTLLLNNPIDCYVPLKWIGADNSTYSNFKCHYTQYGGPFGKDFLGYRNVGDLKEQIASVSLRRTKDLLDLPPKNIIKEYLDMSDTQVKFYQNIVDGIFDEIDKVKLTRTNILSLTARLRQATACPSILTSEPIPSVKQDRCCEYVQDIVSNGDKVVIFSTFKPTVYELAEKLKGYSPLICTGDISDEQISKNIDLFQNSTESKVFIATWQKCGTGITLNAASYAIFIDTPFTAGQYEQACDRIHRIGSKNPVFIYNLISNNTFDERTQELIETKALISDYIVDNVVDTRTFDILKKFIYELK